MNQPALVILPNPGPLPPLSYPVVEPFTSLSLVLDLVLRADEPGHIHDAGVEWPHAIPSVFSCHPVLALHWF